MSEQVVEFESGAKRGNSGKGRRYDLISHIALRRLAETCHEGCEKYGVDNWLKGFPAEDVFTHLFEHIRAFARGDRSEDHLAHAMWNVHVLIHFQETNPELFRNMTQPISEKKELPSEPPCWKVIEVFDGSELVGYRVGWVDPPNPAFLVQHYMAAEAGKDGPSLGWCQNAAEGLVKRFNEQGKTPWEFTGYSKQEINNE